MQLPLTCAVHVLVPPAPSDAITAASLVLEQDSRFAVTRDDSIARGTPCKIRIGLVVFVARDDERCLKDIAELWERGARHLVVLGSSFVDGFPWDSLTATTRAALRACCTVCPKVDAATLVESVERAAHSSSAEWASTRMLRFVEGRRVYNAIKAFGHDANTDLTNTFLAPARLLLHARPDQRVLPSWKVSWKDFQGTQRKLEQTEYGVLGAEIAAAADRISEWVERGEPCSEQDLASLMDLLTESRTAAGERTPTARRADRPTRTSSTPALRSSHAGQAYSVLVVDDHADAWRPVFQVLQEHLAHADCLVNFEFSEDARTAWAGSSGDTCREVHFSFYDLIVLDIFLGTSVDGRQILARLRESNPHLPVVLWTTSREDEITTAASRANRILLKKTVTWGDLVGTFLHWLPEGSIKRHASLPASFFNHLICRPTDRQLVRECTEWCLRQVDSFHALDGSYFTYFTDHGGRHAVKLLELLEQALQPFLEDNSELIISRDARTREFEVLALYLVVIFHELGMFPMTLEGSCENFASADGDYLEQVRTLHALRGMILIHGDVGYWNDVQGRRLGEVLRAKEHPGLSAVFLSDVLAVLVGYHARCFRSLKKDLFLSWQEGKLDGVVWESEIGQMIPVMRRTLASLDAKFTDPRVRERLRRQAALFRFVDAIDLTASRNPAHFMIQRTKWENALRNREHLKRELCARLEIQNGEVSVAMLAVAPTRSQLQKVLLRCKLWGTRQFQGSVDLLLSRGTQDLWSDSDVCNATLSVQKALDEWLFETWKVISGDRPRDDHRNHLMEIGAVEEVLGCQRISRSGRELIASITALSVAGEVLDEYQAIVEADLTGLIRLGRFGWAQDQLWTTSAVALLGDEPMRIQHPVTCAISGDGTASPLG